MTTCIRCHRPLKAPSETGMGKVCTAKSRVQVVPAHERDLFGYDIDKAVHAALYRLGVLIASAAAQAHVELARDFMAARARLLPATRQGSVALEGRGEPLNLSKFLEHVV